MKCKLLSLALVLALLLAPCLPLFSDVVLTDQEAAEIEQELNKIDLLTQEWLNLSMRSQKTLVNQSEKLRKYEAERDEFETSLQEAVREEQKRATINLAVGGSVGIVAGICIKILIDYARD